MATTTCPNCRAENLPEAKFCDDCGNPLNGYSRRQGAQRLWIIGSAPDCDIVVTQPNVSGHHCRLSHTNNGFVLEDLSSTNGTFVNGNRIEGSVSVTPKDVITLGRRTRLPWPQTGNGGSGDAARIIRIGRDADNDVVLDYPMISGHHARIILSDDAAAIEDLGSTNGVAIGSPERKISRSDLSASDTVYFGSMPIPATRLLGKVSLGEKPHTSLLFKGQSMILGRDPNCDQVLDHPMISWHHARLTRSGTDHTVEDLGSTNGTFVNGQRISTVIPVKPGDRIGLGSFSFVFTAEGTIERRDYRGNVTIEARGVGVAVGRDRKRLIEKVSLTIYPSEIVGLMGPSGAGKTTLMNALNGYTPPTDGTVLINGQDLYHNYEQFCGHLGYVPQDDIMHRELTVKQALYYTARLRLPADYRDADIEKRIEDVLKKLDLLGTENVMIGTPEKKGISGGQRKRVNLAMELLTDPSVLFLDEPTSGLASVDAYNVMKVLRELADSGKTVLITIHQPGAEVFQMMDSLVMVSKDKGSTEPGRMVYFGPAYPDSVDFFNPNGIPTEKHGFAPSADEVLRGLDKGKTVDWIARYDASLYKRKYVDDRAGKRPAGSGEQVMPTIKREMGWSQWWTLVKRNLAIKIKDKWNTSILLAQAPIIACLILLVFGKSASGETAPRLGKTLTALFLMIISALWLGCSNAARDIVGELAVYHRERMVNLKIPSYVASKFTVLGLLCVIQCAILFSIVYIGCHLQGPFFLMFSVLTLTSWVALALGLMLSAIARTSEVAIALVPLVLLPMVFLAGMLSPLGEMKKTAGPIPQVIPARWAFEAIGLLEGENRCWKWRQPDQCGNAEAEETDCKTGATRFEKNDNTLGEQNSPSQYAGSDAAQILNDSLSNVPGTIAHHFPRSERIGAPESVAVLALMLGLFVIGIISILRSRDVH